MIRPFLYVLLSGSLNISHCCVILLTAFGTPALNKLSVVKIMNQTDRRPD